MKNHLLSSRSYGQERNQLSPQHNQNENFTRPSLAFILYVTSLYQETVVCLAVVYFPTEIYLKILLQFLLLICLGLGSKNWELVLLDDLHFNGPFFNTIKNSNFYGTFQLECDKWHPRIPITVCYKKILLSMYNDFKPGVFFRIFTQRNVKKLVFMWHVRVPYLHLSKKKEMNSSIHCDLQKWNQNICKEYLILQ